MKKTAIEKVKEILDKLEIHACGTNYDSVCISGKDEAAKKIVELFAKLPLKCNLSKAALRKEAIKYAKEKHQEEYRDPIFAPDVSATISDYLSGLKRGIELGDVGYTFKHE